MDITIFENTYRHPLISQKELELLIDAHKRIHIKEGEFMLKEGKTANEYYLIERGLFRAFVHNTSGNEITTDFFTDNEFLIEVSSLFQRIPSQENLQALTDSWVWKIEFDVFQELFHKIEGIREWGRAWMSEQLFISKRRSINMITTSAKDRYLALLKEKPIIIQQAPLKYIASYLGITDTSLSRIRKELFQ